MPREPSVSERIPTPRGSGTIATCASSREGAARGDRRMFQRLGIALDVSLGTESHLFTARAINLSRGGLFVTTYRALPLGSELSVEFDLPAGRVIARGVVRWERDGKRGDTPGYGIGFAGLSHFGERLIAGFCESHSAPPDEGSAALAG